MTTPASSTNVPAALLRIAAVFGAVSVTTLLIAARIDGDSILRSDDPYIVAFFTATVACGVAVLYRGALLFPTLTRFRHWIALVPLGLWCGFWAAYELILRTHWTPSEARGIPILIAGFSLIAGLIGWALCLPPLPRILCAIAAGAGGLVLAAFALVIYEMS